jgi:hypothetical protein
MFTDIFKKIKKENLTTDEKSKSFLLLKDFMNQHRLENKEISKIKTGTYIKSPFFNIFFPVRKSMVVGVLGLLLFFTGSEVIFAANSALPGEPLYPIKININEKVESFLAVSPKAKAEVKIEQALTRLKEAEQLSSQNKLTPKNKYEIKNKFSAQIESVSQSITKLRENGDSRDASEINGNLKKSLENQTYILSELNIEMESQSTSTETVSGRKSGNFLDGNKDGNQKKNSENKKQDNTDSKIKIEFAH